MYCKSCGKEIAENSKFCKNCQNILQPHENLNSENHSPKSKNSKFSTAGLIVMVFSFAVLTTIFGIGLGQSFIYGGVSLLLYLLVSSIKPSYVVITSEKIIKETDEKKKIVKPDRVEESETKYISAENSETNNSSKINSPFRKLKNNFKWLILALGTLAVVGFVTVWFSGFLSYLYNFYPPIPIVGKTTTLKCNYGGKDISLNETVYSNVNNYYHYNSVKNTILNNNEFSNFVYSNPQDPTIKRLASDIQKIGVDNGLSKDQILELATCFVQNIPYDHNKASQVLSKKYVSNYDLAQFPYETLFKNSGICTDKTYLGGAILKELGYGTAILLFPDAQHMALGIKAPTGYTEFSSDYIMIELTNIGFAPGEIPSEINVLDGLPSVTYNNLDKISAQDDPSKITYFIGKTISAPTLVINVNKGDGYSRIIPIKNLENKIVESVKLLVQLKPLLDKEYKLLGQLNQFQQNAYNSYLAQPLYNYNCGYKYNFYNYQYEYQCNNEVNYSRNIYYNSYISELNSYNQAVSDYSAMILKYNSIVDQTNLDITNYRSYRYN